jgi:peptidoglycan/xylan/chitin deacetylase (PgdA/CDA1 family)
VSEAPAVALTFDAEHPDRPHHREDGTRRILSALGEAGVRATFFVQGRWAESHPGDVLAIAAEGHLLANHSTYHARMTLLTDEGLRADVRRAEDTIRDIAGLDVRPWFRCPFGDGHDDPRVQSALEELGYRDVWWNVEPFDWDPDRSPEQVERDALAGVLAMGDGAVVLLHTWPGSTTEAIPGIIEGLRAAGVRFATVDQLEQLP